MKITGNACDHRVQYKLSNHKDFSDRALNNLCDKIIDEQQKIMDFHASSKSQNR